MFFFFSYADTTSTTPLVFVLSTGSDPFGAFQKFATDMGMKDRLNSISLGQGQGPVAERMINNASQKGDWVFLQVSFYFLNWRCICAFGVEFLNTINQLIQSTYFFPELPLSSILDA